MLANCDAPNCPVARIESKIDSICDTLGGQAVIASRVDDIKERCAEIRQTQEKNADEIFTRLRATEEQQAINTSAIKNAVSKDDIKDFVTRREILSVIPILLVVVQIGIELFKTYVIRGH